MKDISPTGELVERAFLGFGPRVSGGVNRLRQRIVCTGAHHAQRPGEAEPTTRYLIEDDEYVLA